MGDAALVGAAVVFAGAVTAALWLPARERRAAKPAALTPAPAPARP